MAPLIMAIVGGGLIMVVLMPFAGGRELVDLGFYYMVGVPVGMALAAVLAWRWLVSAWSYGFAVALGQCLMLFVLNGEVGIFWPLTLLLFAILALPMVGAGALTGWLQRRTQT